MTPEDVQQATQFLALLFQNEEYVTICCKEPGVQKLTGHKTKLRKEAIDYAVWLIEQGVQVYFGCLPRSAEMPREGTPGKKEHIVGGHVAWVDIDSKEGVLPKLRTLQCPPSLIVDSGNGYHAYWLLTETATPEQIEAINYALTQELRSDESGYDCTQILRVPGSLNLKDAQQPKLCRILDRDWHPEYKYALPELPQAKPKYESVQKKQAPQRQATPLALPTAPINSQQIVFRNWELLSFIKRLPPKAQRMLLCGERMDKDGKTALKHDRSQLVFDTIQQLVSYGWTDKQIHELFLSNMPVKAVRAFYEKYSYKEEELARIIGKVRAKEESRGNILPRLLDQEHLLGERKLITVEAIDHPCFTNSVTYDLRRLATLAQELYEGTRTGCVMAPLPMGTGKTVRFLRPFVAYCAIHTPNRGLIVTMERRKDCVENAQKVNALAGKEVAFALLGHDPDTCSEGCETQHKRDRRRAQEYPVLFLTHAMLARKGVEPFRTWAHGQRVMVIIDEKPAVWWQKGFLTQKGLESLARHGMPHEALTEAQERLSTGTIGQSITPLKARFTEQQYRAFTKLHEDDDDSSEESLVGTAYGLCLLSQYGGHVVPMQEKKAIIVAHRKPLPSLPTLILDATGVLDPEYPEMTPLLFVFPQEELANAQDVQQLIQAMINTAPFVQLHTWDETLTKTKLKSETENAPEYWARLLTEIKCEVLPKAPKEKVYIVCAKDNQASLEKALSMYIAPEDHRRIKLIDHYGNTKGKNDYREAGAIVFTSVQFKPETYYRALALETGRGNPAVDMKTIGKGKKFTDADVEELKVRDQLITVLQEIGRTRLREGKSILIFLPWANKHAVEALKTHLNNQFLTWTMNHTVKCFDQVKTHKAHLLDLLKPASEWRKQELAHVLNVSSPRLSNLLKENAKELWGRHIINEGQWLRVPQESPTEKALKTLENWWAEHRL